MRFTLPGTILFMRLAREIHVWGFSENITGSIQHWDLFPVEQRTGIMSDPSPRLQWTIHSKRRYENTDPLPIKRADEIPLIPIEGTAVIRDPYVVSRMHRSCQMSVRLQQSTGCACMLGYIETCLYVRTGFVLAKNHMKCTAANFGAILIYNTYFTPWTFKNQNESWSCCNHDLIFTPSSLSPPTIAHQFLIMPS